MKITNTRKKKHHKEKTKKQNSVPEGFKISIIGIGQIGGSMALAIKKYLKETKVSVWDKDTSLLHEIKHFSVHVAHSFQDAIRKAHLILLATPVDTIIDLIPQIAHINPHALIADVGSTKMQILKAVNEMSCRYRYVGMHPLAGTEKTGASSWNPDLFNKKPFFIIPAKKTMNEDIALMKKIITHIHAIPCIISAQKHDKILAYTSHLPYLIAISLKQIVKNLNMQNQKIFEGPAFTSMTRIAQCPTSVMSPVVKTNYKNIKKAFMEFKNQLSSSIGG